MSTSRKGRNLPIWMSSGGDRSKSPEKEEADNDSLESNQESGAHKKAKGYGGTVKTNANETGSVLETGSSGETATNFSKLLEGVVLVLSGFVNPERANLRSQALEMGAEYQPDWNSKCTLLVCAFPNTPKFRQVQTQCGTIVSKEWITECYTQKKLVDIDSYLMHPGKPWRKSGISHPYNHDDEAPPSRKSEKQGDEQKRLQPKHSGSSKASRSESSRSVEEKFSPSEVKKWAADDLNKTIEWLKRQDEKPGPDEIRGVAAGGVLTCLQDAIELVEQKQNVQQLNENWNFLPRVVEELIKMEESTVSKDDIHKQALFFKKVYEEELNCVDGDLAPETRKHGPDYNEDKGKEVAKGYDSDETIEMNEEEIKLAFESVASKKPL